MTRSGIAIGLIQLAIVVGVIALAFFLSNAMRPEPTQRRTGEAPGAVAQSVDILRPRPADYTPQLHLNGVVENRTQTAVSPQVSGNVVRVGEAFRSGASFERGDLFFQIDPDDFELSVERAKAEIAAAQSDLMVLEADAEIAIREWRALYPDEEPTDLAARKPQIAAAEARLKSAEAAMKSAELALRRTTVRAPFAGRVLSTQLEVGQFVSPQSPVGQVYPLDAVEVSATLSRQQWAQLGDPVGKPVDIVAGESGVALEGEIARIDPRLDPRTRLATLHASVEGGGKLTLGSFVDLTLSGETVENTLAIPASSFADTTAVWVVEAGALARRTVRRLGEAGDSVIVAAFDTGDGVVVLPPVNAAEGLAVSIGDTRETSGVRNVSVE